MNRALFSLLLAVTGNSAEKGRLLLDEDFRQPAVYTHDFQPVKKAVCRISVTNPELNPRTYSFSVG